MFRKLFFLFFLFSFFSVVDAYVIDSVKIFVEPLNNSDLKVSETIVYDFSSCFENTFRVIPITKFSNVSSFNFSSSDSGNGVGFFYDNFFEFDYFFGPTVCNKIVTMQYSYVLSNVTKKYLDGVSLSIEFWGRNWTNVKELELTLVSDNFLIKDSYIVPSKVFKEEKQTISSNHVYFLKNIPKSQSIFLNALLDNDSFFLKQEFAKKSNTIGFNDFRLDKNYYNNSFKLIYFLSKMSFLFFLFPFIIFCFFYFPSNKNDLSTFQTKTPSNISVSQLAKLTLSVKELKKNKDLIFKSIILQLIHEKKLNFSRSRIKIISSKNMNDLDFFVLNFFDKFSLKKNISKEFKTYLKFFSKGFEKDLVFGKNYFSGHWLKQHNYYQSVFIIVYTIIYISLINSKNFSSLFVGFHFSIFSVFISILFMLIVLIKPRIFDEKNLLEIQKEWNGFKIFLQSEELIYTYKPVKLEDWEELLIFSYFFKLEKVIIKIMKDQKIKSSLIDLIESSDFKNFSLS